MRERRHMGGRGDDPAVKDHHYRKYKYRYSCNKTKNEFISHGFIKRLRLVLIPRRYLIKWLIFLTQPFGDQYLYFIVQPVYVSCGSAGVKAPDAPFRIDQDQFIAIYKFVLICLHGIHQKAIARQVKYRSGITC